MFFSVYTIELIRNLRVDRSMSLFCLLTNDENGSIEAQILNSQKPLKGITE